MLSKDSNSYPYPGQSEGSLSFTKVALNTLVVVFWT